MIRLSEGDMYFLGFSLVLGFIAIIALALGAIGGVLFAIYYTVSNLLF